jgi:hypothetical protein
MKKMNFTSALLVLLISQISGAAVCTLEYSNGGFWQDGRAREIISCNKGNADTKTVVEKNGDNDVPTVLESLLSKGYKIVGKDTEGYTLSK